jgi:hypothetical protein
MLKKINKYFFPIVITLTVGNIYVKYQNISNERKERNELKKIECEKIYEKIQKETNDRLYWQFQHGKYSNKIYKSFWNFDMYIPKYIDNNIVNTKANTKENLTYYNFYDFGDFDDYEEFEVYENIMEILVKRRGGPEQHQPSHL